MWPSLLIDEGAGARRDRKGGRRLDHLEGSPGGRPPLLLQPPPICQFPSAPVGPLGSTSI